MNLCPKLLGKQFWEHYDMERKKDRKILLKQQDKQKSLNGHRQVVREAGHEWPGRQEVPRNALPGKELFSGSF